ncbi:movement protein [Sesamum angolense]|uniref:Movement protein n=1 Tax=Sesamum angolense TaxID=2727404 RepID=A0AAE1VWJ9_9LAMI|nr:movement protein [Sesamum angolense]
MTVSNKTMERIMRQDSNLSPYDGFRIGGIGKVLNQIGLNQRKHHIIYKVSSGEFAIPMEFTGNVMEMQLIPKEEILEELRKLMFDIHPRIAYNLADQDFSRVLTLHQDFKRKDLMKEGNRPYSITYRIAYALSNTHHSDLFLRKEYIEIPRIFKEFAKVMAPDPIRIPRIGGVDIVIKDHPVLDRTMSSRIEYGSRMSFLEDRITGYKGKEKDLARVLTPQEIRVLRREKAFNRIMPINFRSKRGDVDAKLTHPKMQDKRKFGKVLLSFRQQGLIDSDSFYEESEESILSLENVNAGVKDNGHKRGKYTSLENVKRLIQRNFNENPLAWWDRNKIEALKIKEECKYEYVRYKPIQMNMEDKKDMQMIIKEHINLGLIEPGISAYSSPGFLIKMESESKKFTAFSTPQGILIDEAGIELQEHIVEKIRNFPDILKDKKQLQSFLGVVNFAGIFIKDLAKYRKDFRPLLKETESTKWKWEEIHTQRVRELKQVCNNLPKLAIPQDEDELVVYKTPTTKMGSSAHEKNYTGEEPCRYTGGLFTEQQAKVWHINKKNSLRFGRLLRNGLCFTC